jgi:hypothetical protein
MCLALWLQHHSPAPAVVASVAFLVAGYLGSRANGADLDTTTPFRYAIHIPHEATAGMLRRVLDGARQRLAEPRCQEVLDEFSGADGRPLRFRLDELGWSPEDYLGLIVFYDGRKHRRCRAKGTLAVTQVGSRVVYVCPEELSRRARQYPLWAEATLIHEALHTLGLGENPPASREITSAVVRRCGH